LPDVISLEGEPQLETGTRFGGRYEIVRLIGAGGMAAVYEGIHTDLKKRVAIKTLFASVARHPDARARFLREGEAASRIRHPHVVDVTDVGTDQGGLAFLVMEYLEGEDLATLLARETRLAVDRTVELALPVLAAVAAGHAAGVIHRDLKPHNIFLAKGYRGEIVPKVLDFGVSKIVGGDGGPALTRTAAVFGTPAYMSPEQALGAKQVDARCDQYALGLILYECVTGHRTHDGENVMAVVRSIGDGAFDPPRAFRPDLAEAFEAVILRALALKPGDRFSSVQALGAALMPFGTPRAKALWTETFGAAPPSGIEPAWRPTMKLPSTTESTLGAAAAERPATELPMPSRRGRLGVLVVSALLVIGGGVYFLRGKREAPRAPVAIEKVVPPPPVTAPPPVVPREYAVEVTAEPATAALELDGEAVGTGTWSARLPLDGRRHTLRASAAGYEPRAISFQDEPPPRQIALAKIPPPKRPARPRPRPQRDDDILLNRK
jgi:serine/threonine-protein kinase